MHADAFVLEFSRWYIGLFTIAFAVWVFFWGSYWSAATRHFKLEMNDPALRDRFARVLVRREELEGNTTLPWRICGATSAIVGVLVLARVVTPVIGYALLCVEMAVIVSQTYLAMRNRSERRAASLQPRTVTTVVPFVWYAGALVATMLPLSLLTNPRLSAAAIIIAVASAVIVYTAYRLTNMAALLAGDDPEIEVYVDDRLRWMRVATLLLLSYACSFVFLTMSAPEYENRHGWSVPELISAALLVAFAIWMGTEFFKGRMRAKLSA